MQVCSCEARSRYRISNLIFVFVLAGFILAYLLFWVLWESLLHKFWGKRCKQYNKLESIRHVIIIFNDKTSIGCGAIREYDQDTAEIKRMFVSENARKKGIGTKILTELENWAKELGFKKCILETGAMLPEAVSLYKKNNYVQIPNYGQYTGMVKSICFAKDL